MNPELQLNDDAFQSIYTTIITSIQESLGKGSGWIIDSVIDHTISISKYNLFAGSGYIKLPKELDHPRKGLINIQNIDDNECLKRSIVRFLNPANHHQQGLQKLIQILLKRLILRTYIFLSKLETFTKSKKRIPSALAFLVMKIKKNIQSMYQKNVVKKNMLTYY